MSPGFAMPVVPGNGDPWVRSPAALAPVGTCDGVMLGVTGHDEEETGERVLDMSGYRAREA